MGTLTDLATDPSQYDTIDWASEAKGLENPMRAFFWEYLAPKLGKLKRKSVLDIGSGTGWLLDLVTKLGARSAVGLEPSAGNYRASRKLFTKTRTENTTLEKFRTDIRFDVITGLMSIIHIRDLDQAFGKMQLLLTPQGKIFLIVSNYEYWKQPRYGYKVEIEEIGSDEYITRTTRSFGPLTSIVRKKPVYIRAANKSGLVLVEDIPMIPTRNLISGEPKYAAMRNSPIMHLLIFKKRGAY